MLPVVLLAGVLALLAGCTDAPPPPLVAGPEPTRTAGAATVNQVIVGVDDLPTGFNPHSLADLGPVASGVSGLLLPSAFRPAADGTPQLDPTFLTSAEVTSTDPFTVTYQIRRDASWSDGAPIAAEDFAYLADQMRTQPGVVDPAGYRLIDAVDSRGGGKAVQVVFRAPYPGWRTLFTDLLPAHLLKDAPGGWTAALDEGLPAAGGPFSIKSLDRDRGELTLQRNDRYWGAPTVPDQVVLRTAGIGGQVDALRTKDEQLALLRSDAITMHELADLGSAATVRTVPRPIVTQLLLRPVSPVLADERVRRAVAAALDRADLIALGTGSGPGAQLVAQAHVLAPSQPGYTATVPPGDAQAPGTVPDPAQVATSLTAAGYQRVGGRWELSGQPLRLVVAAPANRTTDRAVATRVAGQLDAQGITAVVITPTADDLFGRLLAGPGAGPSFVPPSVTPSPAGGTAVTTGAATSGPAPSSAGSAPPGVPAGSVDIAVVEQPVGGAPAGVLASWYGCPAPAATGPAGGTTSAGGTATAPRTTATTTQVTGPVGGAATLPPNPSGFCDPALQPALDAAMSDPAALGSALAEAEPRLWAAGAVLPLYQRADVLVSLDGELPGVTVGPLLTGPLSGAPTWRRTRH
jgi:ABC-type transport system substrate-binding protein